MSASGKGEAEQFPLLGTMLFAAKKHLAGGQFIPGESRAVIHFPKLHCLLNYSNFKRERKKRRGRQTDRSTDLLSPMREQGMKK